VTSLRVGSVGVEVPLLIGPFTPPLTAPEPVVLCAPSAFALLETPPVFGTFGATALGEAFWFGAGVGEPRLSYCIWADATPPLISKVAAAKIKECVFIFPSFVFPADDQSMATLQRPRRSREALPLCGRVAVCFAFQSVPRA
jgi:hypothetical protein